MPFYGEGLDGLMRARANDLRGILNGIDYDEFNPETDSLIAQSYNAKNFRKEKVKNKRALQEQLGLPVDEKKFTVGIVSRLTDQKGLDLIQCVMDELCSDDMQLIVLGRTRLHGNDLLSKPESDRSASHGSEPHPA
jgi:starch synthase